MKKLLSTMLALFMVAGLLPALASAPTAGSPEFRVATDIQPASLSIYQGEALQLTATTTYTSNKNDNQQLHFVSDTWSGVDNALPATEGQVDIQAQPAAGSNDKQQVFTSTAAIDVSDEPGVYDIYVTYAITLQHDNSGKRTYTVTTSDVMTVTVLEGAAPAAAATEEPVAQGALLNHGQIVSTWAQWKQTKGNENFRAGGPGVYRSLVWYKTQVENKEFKSKQEVIDYLESIYEAAPHKNKDKVKKQK